MDSLSEILQSIRVKSGIYFDTDLAAPWCVSHKVSTGDLCSVLRATDHIVSYHYVVGGGATVRLPDVLPSLEVGIGQLIMFPTNSKHHLSSGVAEKADPEPIRAWNGESIVKIVRAGDGKRARIVSGFVSTDGEISALFALMPSTMIVSAADLPGRDWIARTFDLATSSDKRMNEGMSTVLSRLSELILVEAIRRHLPTRSDDEPGWSAYVGDSAIAKALAFVHARPEHSWTANSLAREVGLSRSGLTDRFGAAVGCPPMRYLTRVRLQRAARKLREGHNSVAQIALGVGYTSEEAFARAFKREFGLPPASWRRLAKSATSKLLGVLMTLGTTASLSFAQLFDFPPAL